MIYDDYKNWSGEWPEIFDYICNIKIDNKIKNYESVSEVLEAVALTWFKPFSILLKEILKNHINAKNINKQ